MALIVCHECGGKVSTEAEACPHCGSPVTVPLNINEIEQERPEQEVRKTPRKRFTIFPQTARGWLPLAFLLLCICIGAFIVWKFYGSPSTEVMTGSFKDDYSQCISEYQEALYSFRSDMGDSEGITALRQKILKLKHFIEKNEDNLESTGIDFIEKLDEVKRTEAWVDSIRCANIRIESNKGWQKTGIFVNAGDSLSVEACGRWRCGPEPKWPMTGPKGYKTWNTLLNYQISPHLALGALIWTVSGARTFGGIIEKGRVFHIDKTGEIIMRINDSDKDNNDGYMDVTLLAYRQP